MIIFVQIKPFLIKLEPLVAAMVLFICVYVYALIKENTQQFFIQ